jgi:copper(I)-binding protein
LRALLAPVALVACAAPGNESAAIRVEDGVASEAVVDRAALYLTLINDGGAADTLTAVAVAGVELATIHATTGGRMTGLDRLALPARDTVRLTVGGTHVMLEGAGGLTAGSRTEATLTFASGRTLTVPVRVVAYADLLDAVER